MTAVAIIVTASVHAQQPGMTFFITSVGKGKGADLGGIAGADAHCAALAKAAGSKETNWKAYLSTTLPKGDAGENARERIGKGPWHNAKGVMVAKNVDDLHSDKANVNKQTALTEKGEIVGGSGDKPNQHDILTGSDPQGMFSTAGGDTTCNNWTSSADGDGSAIVGHHDRSGLKKTLEAHDVLELVARFARLQPGEPDVVRRRRPALLLRRQLRRPLRPSRCRYGSAGVVFGGFRCLVACSYE